jgi:hypothetical protein
MLLGIVMLYILKMVQAPLWCFIVTWSVIVLNAATVVLKAWATEQEKKKKEKLIKEFQNILKGNSDKPRE